MTHAYVVLRDPEGREHELVHGDVVGRLWTAALQLDDGRVSEAHAMISLREGQLQLISLRGALAVGGQPQGQIALRPGLRVQLARGVELEVLDVALPDEVLGVEGDELPRQALPAVCSVLIEPSPRLAQGWREDARLHIWTTGDGWMARAPGAPPRPVTAGSVWPVDRLALRFVALRLVDAGPRTTRRHGAIDAPLHVVAQYDTVQIHRAEAPPLVLAGMQARLVSELVAFGGPVAWATLAGELWPGEVDLLLQRGRLDTVLSRVRRRLRAAGVRADLVHADGAGAVELLLYPSDRVEDRT